MSEAKYLILDIETIPNQLLKDDLKPKFNADSVKLGNVKDPAKIEAKIEAERKAFETGLTKTMSVKSNFCQILSIGYIETDAAFNEIKRDVIFDERNDGTILKHFWKIYNNQTIIGWNSKGFDIPIIWKRGILKGVPVLANYMKLCNKYGSDSIDLMHVWNNFDYGKMSDCAALLGIEAKTGMDGSMIYDAYKEKKFREIADYNMQDCECCLSIANKII